eukprot:99594-Rhodomonas_salina.1
MRASDDKRDLEGVREGVYKNLLQHVCNKKKGTDRDERAHEEESRHTCSLDSKLAQLLVTKRRQSQAVDPLLPKSACGKALDA